VIVPERAMVLAAGRGERMRPITSRLPKPLIMVAGRTLLDRALDRLEGAGVAAVTVNVHYLADQIEAHLGGRRRPPVTISREPELLDTGGGVAKALPFLGPQPFYVLNSDALWRDGAEPALRRLAASWDDRTMDALLLVVPRSRAVGYHGRGDYDVLDDGRLQTRHGESAAHVFAGVQILHPRLFAEARVEPFSLKALYDRAEAAGRLFGLIHDDAWYHVGTPEALIETERLLAEQR